MILAIYERNGEYTGGLWYSWEAYNKETFSPECETVMCYDFTTKGNTYADRKKFVRNFAVDWSHACGLYESWSYGELFEIQSEFERLGRRYGLLREFHENCIC